MKSAALGTIAASSSLSRRMRGRLTHVTENRNYDIRVEGAMINARHLMPQNIQEVPVTRELSKAWWLLALCGILDAAHAAMNLFMRNPDGSTILREFAGRNAVWDMGILAVAAGACVIAVGVWNSGREASWLLSLYGFALGGFGLIAVSPIVRAPLSFRPVSVLFAMMAVSLGAYALATARGLGPGVWKQWVSTMAGAASIGFAFSFLAVGFKLVRLGPTAFFVWMSSYFGLCAIFMLWLAFRVRGHGSSQFGRTERLSPLPRRRHA